MFIRNQEGSALVTVLMVMIVLVILAMTVFTIAGAEVSQSQTYVDSKQAFWHARSGADIAEEILSETGIEEGFARLDGLCFNKEFEVIEGNDCEDEKAITTEVEEGNDTVTITGYAGSAEEVIELRLPDGVGETPEETGVYVDGDFDNGKDKDDNDNDNFSTGNHLDFEEGDEDPDIYFEDKDEVFFYSKGHMRADGNDDVTINIENVDNVIFCAGQHLNQGGGELHIIVENAKNIEFYIDNKIGQGADGVIIEVKDPDNKLENLSFYTDKGEDFDIDIVENKEKSDEDYFIIWDDEDELALNKGKFTGDCRSGSNGNDNGAFERFYQ